MLSFLVQRQLRGSFRSPRFCMKETFMLAENTRNLPEIVSGRARLGTNEFDNTTSFDGGAVEKTLQTKQIGRKPRADIHLRAVSTDSCLTGSGHRTSQPLPALPLEPACGHSPWRQAVRLSWADGTHCRVGTLQRRMGHRAPLQKMPRPADQPNRWRRQRTGPDFAGPATFGSSTVPIGQPGSEN